MSLFRKLIRKLAGKEEMEITGCNGIVTINGVTYTGNNIRINGDKVIIDGKVQNENAPLVGPITVKVDGDVEMLQTTSGDIFCEDVGSIVTTSGDIECLNVSGNIKTISGDVTCSGSIGGNVETLSGDIVGGRK